MPCEDPVEVGGSDEAFEERDESHLHKVSPHLYDIVLPYLLPLPELGQFAVAVTHSRPLPHGTQDVQ
jgi:hypothetical protein